MVTFELPEPASPAGLAAAADGTLWVTEARCRAIDRLTPDGRQDPLELPEEVDGVSIVPGPDGAMYFMQSLDHTLWRAGDTLETINLQVVDRVKRKARPKLLSIAENGGTPGIAMGPADTLWIAASTSRTGGTKGGVAVVNLGGSCIVPDLAGDTVGQARLDLSNHSCALATAATGNQGARRLPGPACRHRSGPRRRRCRRRSGNAGSASPWRVPRRRGRRDGRRIRHDRRPMGAARVDPLLAARRRAAALQRRGRRRGGDRARAARGGRRRTARSTARSARLPGRWPLSKADLAVMVDGRIARRNEDGEIEVLAARGWQFVANGPPPRDVRLHLR